MLARAILIQVKKQRSFLLAKADLILKLGAASACVWNCERDGAHGMRIGGVKVSRFRR